MHCVLDHLLAPLEALQEGLRVLKPGGLIGVRCPMGGDVYEPTEPLLIRGFELSLESAIGYTDSSESVLVHRAQTTH